MTTHPATLAYARLDTPIGPLTLVGDGEALHRVCFAKSGQPQAVDDDWQADPAALAEPLRQFAAYFAGELREFRLRLQPRGTPFQLAVWEALRGIPFGETVSYSAIAMAVGRPSAVRAVGAANGCNPLPVVVPCHRVIGSNGSLTGFGGGLPAKQWLLRHEAAGRDDLFAARALVERV